MIKKLNENHQFTIESVSAENQEPMIAFLKDHSNYSLLLLGNFENYGAHLGEAPYSGNYKVIRLGNTIITVFCLTKRGNLLIHSTVKEPIFSIVLSACLEEKIPIAGLLGEWKFCHSFWKFLKEKEIIQRDTFTSKEILYQANMANISSVQQPKVRLLEINDYSQWKPLRIAYLKESGLPYDLSDEQLLMLFVNKCNKKIIWGFFLEGKLVSIADLNAKASDLGQLGGVYTIPNFRQKGYSKAVIYKLLADLKTIHNIRKLIIFTGEYNLPAQKLYESIGVKSVGHFALLFGK